MDILLTNLDFDESSCFVKNVACIQFKFNSLGGSFDADFHSKGVGISF